MNKKLYNAPEVLEINYRINEVVMVNTSPTGDGDAPGGNSGGTGGNKITESDANKRDAEWGNLW